MEEGLKWAGGSQLGYSIFCGREVPVVRRCGLVVSVPAILTQGLGFCQITELCHWLVLQVNQ
jgi:hypothetical protein